MGFFDDNPFGGMFDWDGDGKESFFEQMVGLGSMEAMMNDDDDEPYVAPFGLDLSDDTDFDPDDLGWDEDGLDLDENDTDSGYYEEAPAAAKPPQETGEYVWTEINPYAVLEQNKKAEMQALADNLSAVAAQKEEAETTAEPETSTTVKVICRDSKEKVEAQLKRLEKLKNADRNKLIATLVIEAALLGIGLCLWLGDLGSHYYRDIRAMLYLLVFFPVCGFFVLIFRLGYEGLSERLFSFKVLNSIPQNRRKPETGTAFRTIFWVLALIGTFFFFDAPQKEDPYSKNTNSYSYSYTAPTTKSYSYTTRKQSTYTTRKNTHTTRKPYYEQNDPDPYDAKDYGDPDDFYYWHEDDFYDYEDAEEYYYNHND